MKKCIFCGCGIEDDCIFCQSCGTKQFILPTTPPSNDRLIIINNCAIPKMGGLYSVNCRLEICEDRVSIYDKSDNTLWFSMLNAVTAVSKWFPPLTAAAGIKFTINGGKTYSITLPSHQKNFIPYIIELISFYAGIT